MNIFLYIDSDSELITYEAIALAFTFATFDHKVQLFLDNKCQTLLTDNTSRIYGMIQSLDLYDMPKAWHSFETLDEFDDDIKGSLDDKPYHIDGLLLSFDKILRF